MKITYNIMRELKSGNLVYSKNLVKAIASQCPDSIVTILTNRKQRHEWIEIMNVKLVTLPFTGIIAVDILLEQLYSFIYLLITKPDVYHSTSTFIPLTPKKTKNIITIHDLNFLQLDFSKIRKLYKVASLKTSIARADQIICISEFTRRELTRHFNTKEKPIRVIWNGHSYSTDRTAAEFSRKPQILSFAHREHKNVEASIRTIQRLKSSNIHIKLIVVGSNPSYIKRLQTLAEKLGVKENIEFRGRVQNHELELIYQESLFLVFLSYYEGFGLPILEAMANGCIVIGSNRCSIPEVIGDQGFCIDPDDIEGAASIISRLINHENEYLRLSNNCISKSKAITWENCAKATFSTYTA